MEWDPTQFFREGVRLSVPFALLVLNQPINERAFAALKKHACFTVCADGGANRYYDLMKSQDKETSDLPSAILGDLDSILPSVRKHYDSLGVEIIHDPDQYSTDFTKCLKYLRANSATILQSTTHTGALLSGSTSKTGPQSSPRLDVLILGGLGGRVDQAFSQIHHLYTMSRHTGNDDSPGELYLISEESISFVLRKGRNVIQTPATRRPLSSSSDSAHAPTSNDNLSNTKSNINNDTDDLYYLEENIGILPASGPAVISTTGLEWDVSDWKTEMGGQISTSNHIRADVVTVETNEQVLFTAELAERFKAR
ncbi:thiamine pyrophosphokinase, putative [Paecilomyces variotii No. 5]|uniref:Thiamine pyrophosphokinase n=1 Tax=Byssochlamys spectabilis (strain No. 5 / NBRC 109023) TaxID=1356009 RepID=V5FHP8_BYSSN|nr:thiamine pyrophosphokinase, putative [Paecilomyces variotii No. 5]